MLDTNLFPTGWAEKAAWPACRLPMRFDVEAARAECLGLPEDCWTDHFNTGRHTGGWQAVALRAAGDAVMDIAPGEFLLDAYENTGLLAAMPALRALIGSVRAPKKSVRLMRLKAGTEILEHKDSGLCLNRGEARLHIPLQTDDQVFFYLDGQRIPLRVGECWYLDVSRNHRVMNRSNRDRIHLVIDCVADAALMNEVANADRGTPYPEQGDPVVAFNRFRERVFSDRDLQQRLLEETDTRRFPALAVELGQGCSHDFSEQEVMSAMNAGHRAWIEQWIV